MVLVLDALGLYSILPKICTILCVRYSEMLQSYDNKNNKIRGTCTILRCAITGIHGRTR